ncbi:MAG: hypothetical protein LBP40_05140 [Campylobacteraceae bacterium]|nr:hypothetical protein [Campylobacteraceae bacterium]
MEEKKHSGFGIASFVMSVLAALLLVATFAVTAYWYWAYILGQAAASPSETMLIIVGIAWILSLFVSSVSIILGIIGLLVKNKKRVFALVGLVISFYVPIIFLIIIITHTGKSNIV